MQLHSAVQTLQVHLLSDRIDEILSAKEEVVLDQNTNTVCVLKAEVVME